MFGSELSLSLRLAATIITLLIIRTFYKYFVKPYFLLRHYRKYKGGLCIYSPITGESREAKKNEIKYGDALYDVKRRLEKNPSLRFSATPLVDTVYFMIHDVDLIKKFLNKESLTTVKFGGLNGNMSDFMKNGLIFTEGEKWKRQRRLISQVFHFDYMNNSLPIIRATAKEWIDNNCECSSTSPSVVNVSKALKMYTSTVLWRIFFGEDKFTEGQNAPEILDLIVKHIRAGRNVALSLWNFIIGPRFFRLSLRSADRQFWRERKTIEKIFYSKFDELREKIINQKEKTQQEGASATNASSASSPSFKNLIELLLGQAEGLPDLEIVSQIFTFFVAGTDTTSELLTISHYLLATHPEVQAKLREEVITQIGKTEEIKYEHISKMEYLNAVIKEALRFGGPVVRAIPRVATQNFTLEEIEIRKGTVISASIAGVAHNPQYFSQPDQFRPERWIEKTDIGTIDNSIHLPFSAGSRKCIGEQLALIESKLLLCELVRRFSIELQTPYELKMGIGIVYYAKSPVKVIYNPMN